MTRRDDIYSRLWGELPDQQLLPLCPAAEKLSEWFQLLKASVENEIKKPSPAGIVAIAQAKILLLDKYFEFRNSSPKSHRNRMNGGGHRCIWHIFEEAYQWLRLQELSLTPPMLFLPPEPPPPPLPQPPSRQVGGIFIGEEDDAHA